MSVDYNFIKSLSHEEAFLFLLKESFDTNDLYNMRWVFHEDSSYYQLAKALFNNEPISPDFFNDKNKKSEGFLRKVFALVYSYPHTIFDCTLISINHFMKRCFEQYGMANTLQSAKEKNRLLLPDSLLTNNYSVYEYWRSSKWFNLIKLETDEKKPLNILSGTIKNIFKKPDGYQVVTRIDENWVLVLLNLDREIDIAYGKKILIENKKNLGGTDHTAPLEIFTAIYDVAHYKSEKEWLALFETILTCNNFESFEKNESVDFKLLENDKVKASWEAIKDSVIPKIKQLYPDNKIINCILHVLNKTPYDQFLQEDNSYENCQYFIKTELKHTNYWYYGRNQLNEWCIPLEEMGISIYFSEKQKKDLKFFLTSNHDFRMTTLALDAQDGFETLKKLISEALGWNQNTIPENKEIELGF